MVDFGLFVLKLSLEKPQQNLSLKNSNIIKSRIEIICWEAGYAKTSTKPAISLKTSAYLCVKLCVPLR